MGFLTSIISATVKTALTPLAITKDAINIMTGDEPETTKNLLESVKEDLDDAVDFDV